jgi:hypothetical protein
MDMALWRWFDDSQMHESILYFHAWRYLHTAYEASWTATDSMDGCPVHGDVVGHKRNGMDVS